MSLRDLLARVASGELSPEAAEERLAAAALLDLGVARVDLGREARTGIAEAVLAEGKAIDDLERICAAVVERTGRLLVTRLDPEPAERLVEALPGATYRRRPRLLTCGEPEAERPGRAAVVAAGTSDLGVAEEVAACLAWLGHPPHTAWDVGVAGLQRLLAEVGELRRADAIVAVAGMDGALPAVVAGLVAAPVVAVPTSVGYGAAEGGRAALGTMLAACSPGVAVVNVDNGFGAAVVAARILRRIAGASS